MHCFNPCLSSLTLCSWTLNHKGDTDWNIYTPKQKGLNNREIHVPRGRFLGGSSGCNGTICVRGTQQDYDDWGVPDFNGDQMFRAMRKVRFSIRPLCDKTRLAKTLTCPV